LGAFEFVVLATLRAAQLMRGCRPRVDGAHKPVVTAQFEIAAGKVVQAFDSPDVVGDPVEAVAAGVAQPLVSVPR
jgi:hypothetical protein